MAEFSPLMTQREPVPPIAAELAAAGFEDAHEIGRGGFGMVHQRSLDRNVAVKVLTSPLAPDNIERFVPQQRAMGKLSGRIWPSQPAPVMSTSATRSRPL